jgi:dTDP-4-dehydrorhamnose reductase
LFGYAGDFISRMMQRSRSQLALRVTDQIGTPTPVDALAAALVRLADRLCARLETPPILHIAGSPPTSRHAWVAAALRANAMTAAADRMVMTPMDASASGAARPHSTPLDSSLFHAIFGQQIDWQSYLTRAPGSM